VARTDDVAQHFDAVARLLATLNVDKTWRVATESERRVLIESSSRRSRCYRITST